MLLIMCFAQDSKPLMPKPELTPGAVAITDEAKLCSQGFRTRDERHVTDKIKHEVFAKYGTAQGEGICAYRAYTTKSGKKAKECCEIDHLVSLELGGSNDVENLWPQPYTQHPGAHEKDVIEGWLNRQVCIAHTMTLAEAQQSIKEDWYAAYTKMLKAKSTAKKPHKTAAHQ